eukprot:CAMPEP_0176002646 /NCGR_PEP_ID=MMETSP0120_2-20121206/756_1 /TAXON_ID=160619 /ORGANISM="Kryptoperidinium foliaceum, Strain CCMP 1326" /LENGTH=351 /DNA_ID=CAMNT_0017335245 /DNA_START=34 /DNA_END=1090 /DNA_ORIENTATION=+
MALPIPLSITSQRLANLLLKKHSLTALRGGTTLSLFSSLTTTTNNAQKAERPRRSLLSVPGSDRRKIEKAAGLNADSVVLDLEDGVPFDRKEEARKLVVETLREQEASPSIFGNSEVCVRINGLETGKLSLDDLQAVLPYSSLDAIVVPKVEHPSDVDFVSRLVSMSSGDGRDVRILAAIESAKGLLNLRDIAATEFAASYLDALIFASEDYCADLELIRTKAATEMLHARSQIVTVAKAYGLQAIDMVHIDFRNLEDLQRECQEGREMGFTGKQAIHPAQLEAIHTDFAPREKDIDFAMRCVEEYEATTTGVGGKGACVVDGIVVDAPVYKWAVKIMKRAQQAGMLGNKQ